jgi:hypothetical protein
MHFQLSIASKVPAHVVSLFESRPCELPSLPHLSGVHIGVAAHVAVDHELGEAAVRLPVHCVLHHAQDVEPA